MNDIYKKVEISYFDKQDYQQAYNLCLEGIKNNEIKCIRFMGWLYAEGHGCPKDEEKALSYFSRAAALGDGEAEYGIAKIYYERKDYLEAIVYLEKAINKGFYSASRILGMIYYYGLGIERDIDKAKELYDQAANNGNLMAELIIAKMLFHGYDGFLGRLKSIPLIFISAIKIYKEMVKNEHSQKLM